MRYSSRKILSIVTMVIYTFICVWLFSCTNHEKKKLIGEREPYKTITKISFIEEKHDFGNISQGDTVNHFFVFKNIGQSNLKIEDVSSSCGCTIPSWPKREILPNDIDSVKVSFTKKNETGHQSREIIVRSNTDPEYNQVYISANVLPIR